MVAADAELLDIYLAGTPPDRLIEEIIASGIDKGTACGILSE